jgi:hypothetical protein
MLKERARIIHFCMDPEVYTSMALSILRRLIG